MRLVRSPLRISIGGGGTDLPFYYRKKRADLTFAAIDKYCYVAANKTLNKGFRISLEEEVEKTKEITEISNDYLRNTLKALEVNTNDYSITSISDVPSGTGLGSSGSFTVALLKALERQSPYNLDRERLAEKAFEIEHGMLDKSCGKQDQYAASFGGLKRLQIDQEGRTTVTDMEIDQGTLKELQESLMLFYTNEKRYSERILKEQRRKVVSSNSEEEKMDRIKEIGDKIRRCLEKGRVKEYGLLLDQHWQTKKRFTEKMTNPKIDKIYSKAKKNGAKGGKIVGAGGGGFLLLFAEEEKQEDIKNSIDSFKVEPMEFEFDKQGCKVVYER